MPVAGNSAVFLGFGQNHTPNHWMRNRLAIVAVLVLPLANLSAAETGYSAPPRLPKGYIIVQKTISPDHRYGITAFDNNHNPIPNGAVEANKLIEKRSGRLVASIQNSGYMTRENHGGIVPTRWAADDSLALWMVFGKWTPDSISLLELRNGKFARQLDVLNIAQKAILAKTKALAPRAYQRAKTANAGNSAAYPDGFTVDVDVKDPISFPLHLTTVLTSNPKDVVGLQELDSHLEGTIDSDGRLKITSFALGHTTPPHRTWL